MGGLLDCFPQRDIRATARADGRAWADVVVKIGGSACTRKAQFETLNVEALNAISQQLAAMPTEGFSLAVVHGAGSFGHQHAKEYGVSKGCEAALTDRLREGFAKTRLSVTTLNKHVITALLKEGLPAVSMSPCPFVTTERKKLRGGRLDTSALEGTRGLLQRGFVPVVHGDAVLDEAQGVAILSGDVWMVELCRELGAKSAVFVTDVDGVFTKPPWEDGAELVPEILVDQRGELELKGVSMNTASHDVTGGLKAKLESAADVLRGAPSVQAVYIVRAGSSAAAEALRGKAPKQGTTLRRR
ncbi:unnamed protein product [Effrenium voratum]|nr:unnamed protein product [Effrenium voratum]